MTNLMIQVVKMASLASVFAISVTRSRVVASLTTVVIIVY